ncbi:MAG: ATP synthase F0 subunit C [Candidatus Sumerlaeia bacterium]|nr:ATP synthase F0 subunit C [Candidatus Sumerlaeia bacterium]
MTDLLTMMAALDAKTALGFAYPLGLGLAAIGAAFGLGRAVGSAMESMGRQPEAIPQIQTAMIIGCAFIEALAIYALIAIFLTGSLTS